MKRHDNGMIELRSVMKPKADNIGDAAPKYEKGREITICYEDAHMNKVSGVAITVSVGGLLKDYKF